MYLKPHVEARRSCGLSISDFSEELVFLPMILNAVYRRLHLINFGFHSSLSLAPMSVLYVLLGGGQGRR